MINQIENASLIYEILVYLNSFYFGKCRHFTQIILTTTTTTHSEPWTLNAYWEPMKLINEFVSRFYLNKGCWHLSNMVYSFSKRVSWIVSYITDLGIKYLFLISQWNLAYIMNGITHYAVSQELNHFIYHWIWFI